MNQKTDSLETQKLKESFLATGEAETENESLQKDRVFDQLEQIWREWIVEVSVQREMPRKIAKHLGGKLGIFGSRGLKVNLRSSDIDILCIAPRHISRSDFETSFVEKLKSRSDVKDLHIHIVDVLTNKKIKIGLKLKFDDVEVDLLFCSLPIEKIQDNLDFLNDAIYEGMEGIDERSLLCYRTSLKLLDLVPNLETFRFVLSVVKLWAKRQGLYAANVGYLDGIAWAILVTKICELYPTTEAAIMIRNFFDKFSGWPWPEPVITKTKSNLCSKAPTACEPKTNVAHHAHLMPLLRPIFPYSNCAPSVSKSNLRILMQEFRNGLRLTEEILRGRAKWDYLFQVPKFLENYRYFIVIIASSKNENTFEVWKNVVEKNIIHLVTALDKNSDIDFIRVNSKTFKVKEEYFEDRNRLNCVWCFGLQFANNNSEDYDINPEMKQFENEIHKYATELNINQEGTEVEINKVNINELKMYLSEKSVEQDQQAFDIHLL